MINPDSPSKSKSSEDSYEILTKEDSPKNELLPNDEPK
jgi:hypothetical protein